MPAPAAPVEPEIEKAEPSAESYVAVIHPKENKQGWQTITTSEELETTPVGEQENDATGVNEEAAIGQEAFVVEAPVEINESAPLVELSPEEKELLAEMEAENAEPTVTTASGEKEENLLADGEDTEELETEGTDTFSEEETVEQDEEDPISDEFIDAPVDDFIDGEPPAPVDEEPEIEEEAEQIDEVATFSEEELAEAETVLDEASDEIIIDEEDIAIDQNPIAEQPETEGVETFEEQEIIEPADETALEEIDGEPIAEEEAMDDNEDEANDKSNEEPFAVAGGEPIADEIETEGVESFSEEELPEPDEAEVSLEEISNESEENIVEDESIVGEETLSEEGLVLEETISAENGIIGSPTTVGAEEAVGKQRGRKPIQDYDDDASNLNVPPDEELFKRQYYSMRETAAMFGVNQSLLRFWENEFKILQPKKNKKGDRYFRPIDVKNLVLIYHLLRVRKFTMEGAKEYLQSNKKAGDALELSKRLEKLKSFLLELKASL